MYCFKCGKKILESSKFCTFCRANLTGSPSINSGKLQTIPGTYMSINQRKIMLIVIVTLCVLSAALIVKNESDIDKRNGMNLVFGKEDNLFNCSYKNVNSGVTAVNGEWIYFSNTSDGAKLYKIRTDGSKKTLISNDSAICIYVLGNWLYYSNVSDNYKMCKIKTDGTQRTPLNSDFSLYKNVISDWFYYTISKNEENNNTL